jgi:ParB family transcriptional regulator, chromosome partitioning protein
VRDRPRNKGVAGHENDKRASQGQSMTITSTAEKPVPAADKDKVEKRRALGRGLESLLPGPRAVSPTARPVNIPAAPVAHEPQPRHDSPVDIQAVVDPDVAPHETIEIHAQAEGRTPGNLVVNIPLDRIDKNPYQTRYLFDKEMLEELRDSILANGVVQPVVVRPGDDGRYVLILGERRCRASKLAGKETIPAIVRRVSEQQAAEMTIVENLQREDLNCLEQAEAFRVLSQQFNLTQQQIGDRVGMSRESVSNYMRLLKLPKPVMELLTNNKLTFSQARELLVLEDMTLVQRVADEAVKKNLTDEQIEDLVAKLNGWPSSNPGLPEAKARGGARWVDPNVRAAQLELERVLGLRVRIKDRKGKGKIVIEYATVDDYERVVEALKKQ